MSANMRMFPDDWMDFVEANAVKETKFGTEYVPKLAVIQGMGHYIKNQDDQSAISEAISENPYLVMSVCLEAMHQRIVDEVTITMEQKFIQKDLELAEKEQKLKAVQEQISKNWNLDILYRGEYAVH